MMEIGIFLGRYTCTVTSWIASHVASAYKCNFNALCYIRLRMILVHKCASDLQSVEKLQFFKTSIPSKAAPSSTSIIFLLATTWLSLHL